LKRARRENMCGNITIRLATMEDAQTLIEFNRAMALETEHKHLVADTVSQGVEKLLSNPDLGFYIVAESGRETLGSLMVTTEWSDWRDGIFWWIQSVYVKLNWRRRGVFRSLYNFVKELAKEDPSVCGFRLYVERNNLSAQKTYQAVGMHKTPYRLFEELKDGIE